MGTYHKGLRKVVDPATGEVVIEPGRLYSATPEFAMRIFDIARRARVKGEALQLVDLPDCDVRRESYKGHVCSVWAKERVT